MQTPLKTLSIALLAGSGLVLASQAVLANESVTQDGYVTGTMVIDWHSRLPQNQENDAPKPGIADVYQLDATVGNTFYKGSIQCVPYVFSRHLGRLLQEGSCQYDVNIGVINPADTSQRAVVGKVVGTAPKDREGRVDLGRANLRVEVQAMGRAQAFTSNFAGVVVSSPVKATSTLREALDTAAKQSATITRMVGEREVSVTLGDVDPVKFQRVTLAAGPSANYTEAVVDGQLVYSYETDNWFPTLTYSYGGTQDVVSGGMKWVELSDTEGRYELNVVFNEDKGGPQDEAAFFGDAQGEEAFFMSTPNRSTINGTIHFKDTYTGGVERPVKSAVTYNMGVQKLTAQQAQLFWKTLLLIPSQVYGE